MAVTPGLVYPGPAPAVDAIHERVGKAGAN